MSGISITTDSLKNVAHKLHSLSDNMHSISNTMERQIHNMREWRDPQAEKFIDTAMMTKQNLDLHVSNFVKMSKFLDRYASKQEEAEREQARRISSINH